MKQILRCVLLLLLVSSQLHAQHETGTFRGNIINEQGESLIGVSVGLKGTRHGASTDAQGRYTIEQVPKGSYLLVVSGVGFESLSVPVTVYENQTMEVPLITLKEDNKLLDAVVVSAGRTREHIDQIPSSVSVIGLKEIEQNIAISTNIGDILENHVPGLAPSTGLSSNWGQTLRGRTALVMIDGVPQSTPLRNGAMDIRALDPAVVKRIEVVKGATAIYGNGAAGGLINYITRNPKSDKLINSRTSIGSTGSLVESANSAGIRLSQLLDGKIGNWSYVASGVYEQTGELKDADGDVMPPVYGLGEMDSYNAFAKLAYQWHTDHKVQLSYNFYSSQQNSNYHVVDGDYSNGIKTTVDYGTANQVPQGVKGNQNLNLAFTGNTGLWNTTYNLDAYYQNVDNVFFYSTSFLNGGTSRILSKKNGARLVLQTPAPGLAGVNVTYGMDYQTDNTSQPLVDGRTWVPEMLMSNAAPFAQAKAALFDVLILKGGFRYEAINIKVDDYNTLEYRDNPSIFVNGGTLSYNQPLFNAGARLNLNDWFEPFASFSQGFSVSDIGRVLRAAQVDDIKNINTKAVVIDSYEAGFVSRFESIARFEASGYISKSELGVNSVYDPETDQYKVARAPQKIWGYEAALDVNLLKDLTVGVSYAFVEGRSDENDNGDFEDAEDIYLRGNIISPPRVNAHIDYTLLDNTLSLTLQYNGIMERNRFERNADGEYDRYEGPVNPYNVFNGLINYKLDKHTSLSLGVENIFNEDYFYVRSQWGTWDDSYYKAKGTSFRINLNINI